MNKIKRGCYIIPWTEVTKGRKYTKFSRSILRWSESTSNNHSDFTRNDVIFRPLVSTSFQSFSPRFVEIKFNYYSMTSVRWALWKFPRIISLFVPRSIHFRCYEKNLTYLSFNAHRQSCWFFFFLIMNVLFNQITNSKIGMCFNHCK